MQYNNNTSTIGASNSFHFQSNFSTNNQVQISNKLIQIDNRIQHFTQYSCILWTLLILSLLALFGSIYSLSSDDVEEYYKIKNSKNMRTYDILTFFVNLIHAGGYFYSINSFTKQNSMMSQYTEYILLGLAASNFLYFFVFIFIAYASFMTWCMDIFYLILNLLLYYQTKEITLLFLEKERTKTQYENMII
jgi:hypothetical protein